MKTTNPDNYRLIKSVAFVYCDKTYTEDIKYDVFYEHEQFWLRIGGEGFEETFSVIDACCPLCGNSDYCFVCGRHNQIDFELVERIEF